MAVENRIEQELNSEFFDTAFANCEWPSDTAETVGSAFIAAVDGDDEWRERVRTAIAEHIATHDGAEDWLAVADIIRRWQAKRAAARRED